MALEGWHIALIVIGSVLVLLLALTGGRRCYGYNSPALGTPAGVGAPGAAAPPPAVAGTGMQPATTV